MFVTTGTSLGKPSRAPEGHLKLIPRPWWSLGACRPLVSPGPRLLFVRLDIRFGDPFALWGSLARRPRPKTIAPGRHRDFDRDLLSVP
ncbi:hypothetical protein CDL15_Pgr021940 [Punica granatum]|uniref:Uncharacterized protein n=1 Tax=Punica granatum TaxID=22663 RepID=A0A218XIT4_PUNGR|nr:hypothetical protein CDL15_Pgr021940 [Punica granatum]